MTEWKVPVRTDIKPGERGLSDVLNTLGKAIEELREAVDKPPFDNGGSIEPTILAQSEPTKRKARK